MGAASAAISPLGLELDLMEHKVLMRMRSGARCKSGGASNQMAGVDDWMEARAREAVARLRGTTTVRATASGGRRGRMGSTLTRAALFIGGPLDLPVVVPSAVQRATTTLSR
jgi:hypothetical protein